MFKAYACIPGETAIEITKEQVAKYLKEGKSHIWIDISSNIAEHEEFLTNVMHIHQLAIEDMSHPLMLPKVEQYEDHIFLILHDIILREVEDGEQLSTHELYVFLGKNFVLTARRQRVRAADAYHDELTALSRLFIKGAESVGHAILRKMIDSFFPMLDRIETKLDSAEERIFDTPTPKDLENIFVLRKTVLKLRAIAVQQLDVINRLVTGEFETLSSHCVFLMRDLYDHLFRLSERTTSFRELITGLLDAYLSQASNKMNEIMKVLTIIATTMLPLGIIVGYYGMNFKNMPGLTNPYGWLYALASMCVLIGGMLAYFKKKKWL